MKQTTFFSLKTSFPTSWRTFTVGCWLYIMLSVNSSYFLNFTFQYVYFRQMSRAATLIQNQFRSYCEHKRFKKSLEGSHTNVNFTLRGSRETTPIPTLKWVVYLFLNVEVLLMPCHHLVVLFWHERNYEVFYYKLLCYNEILHAKKCRWIWGNSQKCLNNELSFPPDGPTPNADNTRLPAKFNNLWGRQSRSKWWQIDFCVHIRGVCYWLALLFTHWCIC